MAPDVFIRIEDYLDNNLSPDERLDFEEQLCADPELAQAFALVREARERLVRQWANEPADAALMETLRQVGREYFQGSSTEAITPKRVALLPRIGWAAAAVLLLLLGAWLFFLRPPYPERLYAQYKELPEASFAVRSGEEQLSLAEEAARAFNRGQYSEALALLERHLEQVPHDTEARYFSGLCLLELKRFEEARRVFAQVEQVPIWADEARWYTALTDLRQKRIDDCIYRLRQIDPQSARYAQAQRLLKDLNR